jgi:hypothetical protein
VRPGRADLCHFNQPAVALASGKIPMFRSHDLQSLRFKLSCIAVLGCLLALSANAPSAAVTVQRDESFFTHLHTEKAMANVTVSPGRAGPVVITIQLETADEAPLEARSVSVTLTDPETSAPSQVAQAERIDGDQWQTRMSAPSPGRWMLGLGISISDTDRVDIESPILIR